jgi:hypothetical protein
MTPSEQCKAAGLRSLAEVAEMVRKPPQTLRNWHRDSPELFAVVVAGAVVIKAANVEVTGWRIKVEAYGNRINKAPNV